MGRLSTHVLDTSCGRPAAGVHIVLERLTPDGARQTLVTATTNADGRTDGPLLGGAAFQAGSYEMTFHIGDYFRARQMALAEVALAEPAFLDRVPVRFQLESDGNYHVPLLVTPWSYSTYRGS